MAAGLKTSKDWERYDATRMVEAMGEISASPNLKFLFRSLMNACGLNSTPHGETEAGRHEAGMILVGLMLEHDPALYPNLILEDVTEQRDRSNAEE